MTITTSPDVELRYVPDFNDLMAASTHLRTRRYPAGARVKFSAIAFSLVAVGAALAVLADIALRRAVPAVPNWIGMVAVLALTALLYAKILQPWMLRQSAAIIQTARKAGPMQFTSGAEGMRWADGDIDFQLRWSGVEAIYGTTTALAFMSGAIALVLPYSAFSTTEARRDFVEYALSAIPADAARVSRADKSLQALLAAQ
ncbi:YcxB family protein [Devosia sp. 2618]|uniref:YcxB family protein n=1 Tax=Devosia sp. 2618 TaxID=3156454 RepID=UPI0033980F35